MNKFGKLVWIGLMINILLLCAVAYISTQFRDMVDQLKYIWREVMNFLPYVIIPFSVAIVLQIISLPLLFNRPKLGLTLAFMGCLIMLPLSLVFMSGYIFSYETQRNKSLKPFVRNEINTPEKALSFKTSALRLQGGLSMVIGLLVGSSGASVGWLLVCTGIISLLQASRLTNRLLIGVVGNQLIITPAMYSDTYLVPLSDVELIKDNKRMFKLHIRSTGINRKCAFSKRMIAEKEYQTVLDDILSRLAKSESAGAVTADSRPQTRDV